MESGLHIGKISGGWVFHFQAHNFPELKTVAQYRKLLKKGFIYNEYDEKISYKNFWIIVESSLMPDPWDPEPPYSFKNLPKDEVPSVTGVVEWTDDDFMFTLNEFS